MIEQVKQSLTVWHVTNFHEHCRRYAVDTPEQAAWLIDVLATADLGDPRITDNAFGLEIAKDGEWVEWEHPESGMDIDEFMTDLGY